MVHITMEDVEIHHLEELQVVHYWFPHLRHLVPLHLPHLLLHSCKYTALRSALCSALRSSCVSVFFSMSSFRIRRNNMSYYTFCSPLLPCPFLYPPFVPPALFWLRSLFLVTGEVQIIIAESIPSLVPLYSVGRNSNIFYGKIAYLITMRHSITQNQDRNLSSVS